MKFPAFKKEIHGLLVRRILGVCILAILLVVAATSYLEIKKLESTLLSNAQKEARIFVPLFLEQLDKRVDSENVTVSSSFSDSINHTSFIDVKLLDRQNKIFFEKKRVGADLINKRFLDTGIEPVFGDKPDGNWLFADKQIYLNTVIPVIGLQDDDVIGHLQAIYRSSLDDTRQIATRILLSCLIGVCSVLICGILMYPGLVFFHNRLIKNSSDLNRANNFLLKQLGTALAKSDVGLPEHNHRTLIYAVRLAEKLNLTRSQIRSLIQGAFLHDLGMLDLDSTMLMKPTSLGSKERAQMQGHVKKGAALIKPYRWLRDGKDLIRCHHEKYDGSGYPAGLSHDKIPLEARIFAIVDAFDALTSKRPYREAQELDRAIEMLELESASHFDPVLLAPFIEMAPQLFAIVSKMEGKALERELSGVLKKYVKL